MARRSRFFSARVCSCLPAHARSSRNSPLRSRVDGPREPAPRRRLLAGTVLARSRQSRRHGPNRRRVGVAGLFGGLAGRFLSEVDTETQEPVVSEALRENRPRCRRTPTLKCRPSRPPRRSFRPAFVVNFRPFPLASSEGRTPSKRRPTAGRKPAEPLSSARPKRERPAETPVPLRSRLPTRELP